MVNKITKLLFVLVFLGSFGETKAQVTSTREFFREIQFSTKEKEKINPILDSSRVGLPIQVTVRWNRKYLDKIEFDSICFVRKLSPEEQQRTGKKEELIRDTAFASYTPTPEEIKAGQFTFTANPRYTVRFFFTHYWQPFIRNPKRNFFHPIRIVDEKGKELFYNNKK